MMNRVWIILCFFVLISCSNKHTENDVPGDYDYIYDLSFDDVELTSEAYRLESLRILERHKSRLQVALPNAILDQVNLVRQVVSDIEIASVKSYDLDHTLQAIEESKLQAYEKLFEKELEVNSEYFLLLYELQQLNDHFENNLSPSPHLKNFFDVGTIVLAEEVSYKIEELIRDDKEKVKRDKISFGKNLIIEVAIESAKFIPGGGAPISASMRAFSVLAKKCGSKKSDWKCKYGF